MKTDGCIEAAGELIDALTAAGIAFEPGLTEEELGRVETLYGFTFPASLRTLLSCGLPVSEDDAFPRWRDFSEENVSRLRQRMKDPFVWLKSDIMKQRFWLPGWGECPIFDGDAGTASDRLLARSPVLIPIFSHRYMPALEGCDDPPVISTVGRDTVLYGAALAEYLRVEFLGAAWPEHRKDTLPRIPVWGELCFPDEE